MSVEQIDALDERVPHRKHVVARHRCDDLPLEIVHDAGIFEGLGHNLERITALRCFFRWKYVGMVQNDKESFRPVHRRISNPFVEIVDDTVNEYFDGNVGSLVQMKYQ